MRHVIRSYSRADWPEICRVHDAARIFELRDTVGLAAFLTLEQTADAEGLFDAALDVLETADGIVGFVAYSKAELTWLYVDPSHFRKGFGRLLLRHAINNADPIFMTEVLEGNIAAAELYFSEDFIVAKRIEGKLAGNEGFAAVGLLLERRRDAASQFEKRAAV